MNNYERMNYFGPELRRFFALLALLLLGHLSLAQEELPETTIPTALNYIANNEIDAINIARQIDFLHDSLNEHPSNMCGPLSAALLLDIQALKPEDFPQGEVDLSYFWLAQPAVLAGLLTPDHFDQFVLEGPIWAQNFSLIPLQVGDFIYLQGGTFDHMLVITRVVKTAEGQQAFSVTNTFTKEGMVIQERLLYDSADVTQGLFFDDFTNRRSWTGQTGATRTYIYRPKRALQLHQSPQHLTEPETAAENQ